MAVQLAKSVGKATHRLCSCTTQVVSKFPKDMIDAIRALVYLASCGNRYQQQWLSQQVPAKPTVWLGKGSVARATYLRCSWPVQLVWKLDAGLRDVCRVAALLPERGDRQQQH